MEKSPEVSIEEFSGEFSKADANLRGQETISSSETVLDELGVDHSKVTGLELVTKENLHGEEEIGEKIIKVNLHDSVEAGSEISMEILHDSTEEGKEVTEETVYSMAGKGEEIKGGKSHESTETRKKTDAEEITIAMVTGESKERSDKPLNDLPNSNINNVQTNLVVLPDGKGGSSGCEGDAYKDECYLTKEPGMEINKASDTEMEEKEKYNEDDSFSNQTDQMEITREENEGKLCQASEPACDVDNPEGSLRQEFIKTETCVAQSAEGMGTVVREESGEDKVAAASVDTSLDGIVSVEERTEEAEAENHAQPSRKRSSRVQSLETRTTEAEEDTEPDTTAQVHLETECLVNNANSESDVVESPVLVCCENVPVISSLVLGETIPAECFKKNVDSIENEPSELDQGDLRLSASELDQGDLRLSASELDQGELILSASELDQGDLRLSASELDQGYLRLSASELDQGYLRLSASELDQGELKLSASELYHGELRLSASELDREELRLSASEKRDTSHGETSFGEDSNNFVFCTNIEDTESIKIEETARMSVKDVEFEQCMETSDGVGASHDSGDLNTSPFSLKNTDREISHLPLDERIWKPPEAQQFSAMDSEKDIITEKDTGVLSESASEFDSDPSVSVESSLVRHTGGGQEVCGSDAGCDKILSVDDVDKFAVSHSVGRAVSAEGISPSALASEVSEKAEVEDNLRIDEVPARMEADLKQSGNFAQQDIGMTGTAKEEGGLSDGAECNLVSGDGLTSHVGTVALEGMALQNSGDEGMENKAVIPDYFEEGDNKESKWIVESTVKSEYSCDGPVEILEKEDSISDGRGKLQDDGDASEKNEGMRSEDFASQSELDVVLKNEEKPFADVAEMTEVEKALKKEEQQLCEDLADKSEEVESYKKDEQKLSEDPTSMSQADVEVKEEIVKQDDVGNTTKTPSSRDNNDDDDDLSNYDLIIEDDTAYNKNVYNQTLFPKVASSEKKTESSTHKFNKSKTKPPAKTLRVVNSLKTKLGPCHFEWDDMEGECPNTIVEEMVAVSSRLIERKQNALRGKSESSPFMWDLEDSPEKIDRQVVKENTFDVCKKLSFETIEEKVSKSIEFSNNVKPLKRWQKDLMGSKGSDKKKRVSKDKNVKTQNTDSPSSMLISVSSQTSSSMRVRKRPKSGGADQNGLKFLCEDKSTPNDLNSSNGVIIDEEISFNTKSFSIIPSELPKSQAIDETSHPQQPAKRARRRLKTADSVDSEKCSSQPVETRENSTNQDNRTNALQVHGASPEGERPLSTKRQDKEKSAPSDAKRFKLSPNKSEDPLSPKLKRAGLIRVAKYPPASLSPDDKTLPFTRSSEAALKAFNQKSLRNRKVLPVGQSSPTLTSNSQSSAKHPPELQRPSKVVICPLMKLTPTASKATSSQHMRKVKPLGSSAHINEVSRKVSKQAMLANGGQMSTAAVVKRRTPSLPRKDSKEIYATLSKRGSHKQSPASTTIYRVEAVPKCLSKSPTNASEACNTVHTPLPPGEAAVKPKKLQGNAKCKTDKDQKPKWKINKEMKPSKARAKQQRATLSFRRT